MSNVVLPYQASRRWMEAEILAGRPLNSRAHDLSVEITELDPELRDRVGVLLDSFARTRAGKTVVFDSGIDPNRAYGDGNDEDLAAMDVPIVAHLGVLPEVEAPTDDVATVVAAWEGWLDQYIAEALPVIDALNQRSPAYCVSMISGRSLLGWGPVELELNTSMKVSIEPQYGPRAMRDALAADLRKSWMRSLFDRASITAARDAVEPGGSGASAAFEGQNPEQLARCGLERGKRIYALAKAHHSARRALAPSFEEEMARWVSRNGSERLHLGLEDGYRMNAVYLKERLAAEVPGFYAMSSRGISERWATRASSPTREGLQLRRLVEAAIKMHAPKTLDGEATVEVMVVKEPPHQIYLPDPSDSEYPHQAGWPWRQFPHPFEAVVVLNWLGRFHLIGAVTDSDGKGPPGIWAVPNPDWYEPDGTVMAQDPDAPEPAQAKRKPPNSTSADDDIPF